MESEKQSLRSLVQEQEMLVLKMEELKEEYKLAENKIKLRLAGVYEAINLHKGGLDPGRVYAAREVIYATDYARGGDDRFSVKQDAIKNISAGGGKLWREFFATKNYAHWRGQRCDCSYGCCPSHGSICFEIGLTNAVRKRSPQELGQQEIEDALYYLLNLEEIQTAGKEKAK